MCDINILQILRWVCYLMIFLISLNGYDNYVIEDITGNELILWLIFLAVVLNTLRKTGDLFNSFACFEVSVLLLVITFWCECVQKIIVD